MVVRMRHTRSHTKNRRSHHALKDARLSTTEAGIKHPRHKALLDGTPYKGRVVMDTTAKRTAKTQAKAAAKAPKEEKRTEEKVTEPTEEKPKTAAKKQDKKEGAASEK